MRVRVKIHAEPLQAGRTAAPRQRVHLAVRLEHDGGAGLDNVTVEAALGGLTFVKASRQGALTADGTVRWHLPHLGGSAKPVPHPP